MHHCLRSLPLALVIFFFTLPATAKTVYPKPQAYVNDFAGVMTAETRDSLENLVHDLNVKTTAEVAVVTLPALNDEPIANVASDLFKEWGIGKKGKDNGVLFLIAPSDRRMRIEVGYGLEPVLPDAMTGRILDTYVVPQFKKGDLNAGILQGTQAIVQVIANNAGASLDAAAGPPLPELEKKKGMSEDLGTLLVIILVVILFIRYPRLFFFLWLFGGRGGRGGGGGSSGSGFGGFGGGSSGGGGSSRSW